jgi:hypothetical protein
MNKLQCNFRPSWNGRMCSRKAWYEGGIQDILGWFTVISCEVHADMLEWRKELK